MKIKNYGFVILFFGLYSCGAGWSDLMLDMGNNYHYYGEGTPFNYIYYENNINEQSIISRVVVKPNVESFAFNENFILAKQKPNFKSCAVLLGDELNNVAWTFKRIDSFSFEKLPNHLQKRYLENLKDSIFYRKIALKITPENTIEEQMYFISLADSIIKTDKEYQKIFEKEFNYWIIEKETNRVFGPFTYEEYLEKKKELGVSEALVMHGNG